MSKYAVSLNIPVWVENVNIMNTVLLYIRITSCQLKQDVSTSYLEELGLYT